MEQSHLTELEGERFVEQTHTDRFPCARHCTLPWRHKHKCSEESQPTSSTQIGGGPTVVVTDIAIQERGPTQPGGCWQAKLY